MSNPNFVCTTELKPFLGEVVGFVKINKPYVHHNASFECAAWWEDSEIKPGVYPLTLEKNYHVPYDLQLATKLDAVVVDDFFPSLFGGVAVSSKPYVPQNLGEPRKIGRRFDIVEAIERSGNSPDGDYNLFLNPILWQAFVDSANQSLDDFSKKLGEYYAEYLDKTREDKYNSRLSMVSYCAENMAALGKAIQCILRSLEYSQQSWFISRHDENTRWVLKGV